MLVKQFQCNLLQFYLKSKEDFMEFDKLNLKDL